MKRKIGIWYFSCSGNSKEIAKKINGLFEDGQADLTDITTSRVRREIEKRCSYSFLTVVFPIYGGDVPAPLKEFFQNMEGNHTTVCLVALYGSVHKGKALFQMENIMRERKFNVVSGAEIVTPHSYCNEHINIGLGRPNLDELDELLHLVRCSVEKSEGIRFPVEKENLKTRVVAKLPPNFVRRVAVRINYDQESCSKCGRCVIKCPADAIQNNFKVNPQKCMRCLACVYCCPCGAKRFEFRNPIFERFIVSNASYDEKSSYYL